MKITVARRGHNRDRENVNKKLKQPNTMNAVLLTRIRETYGEEVATEVQQEHNLGHSEVAALAKALARRETPKYVTSEPFTSVPIPMRFDLSKRLKP